MSIFQWRLDGFSQNIYLLQNYQVLELKNKGRALLSSSLARATRVLGTAILMCYAVQLVWIYGNKSLQIVCKYTCDFAFWAFFRKPEKLGSHTGSKWWPGDPDVKDDPNDPLTRWPNDPVPCLSPMQLSLNKASHSMSANSPVLNIGIKLAWIDRSQRRRWHSLWLALLLGSPQ